MNAGDLESHLCLAQDVRLEGKWLQLVPAAAEPCRVVSSGWDYSAAVVLMGDQELGLCWFVLPYWSPELVDFLETGSHTVAHIQLPAVLLLKLHWCELTWPNKPGNLVSASRECWRIMRFCC